MDYIYTALIQRFADNAALFTTAGLHPIAHIDKWKQQYITPELHLPYRKPAIFYAWQGRWKDRHRLIQEGELTVTLHIQLENYGQSFSHSENRAYALQIFEYHRRINALVHGYGAEGFTPLRRLENTPDENPTDSNVELISYSTRVRDCYAQEIADAGLIKAPLDDMTTHQVPMQEPVDAGSRYIID